MGEMREKAKEKIIFFLTLCSIALLLSCVRNFDNLHMHLLPFLLIPLAFTVRKGKKQKKMKIYLDTNIIYGYFYAKALELKGKRKYKEPKIIEFLATKLDKIDYFTSTLVKGEVFRRLVTEFGLERKNAEKLWLSLKRYLNFFEIRADIPAEKIWREVLEIVSKVKIKKRLTNLEHLILAEKFNLWFLTGDKEIIEKCKKFYPHILSYVEFRKYLNTKGENNNHETKGNRENDNPERKKGEGFGSYENYFKGRVRENNDAHIQENGKEIKIDNDYETQGFQNNLQENGKGPGKGKSALKNDNHGRIQGKNVSNSQGNMGENAKGKIIFFLTLCSIALLLSCVHNLNKGLLSSCSLSLLPIPLAFTVRKKQEILKKCKRYYKKVISYAEFRKLLNKMDSNGNLGGILIACLLITLAFIPVATASAGFNLTKIKDVYDAFNERSIDAYFLAHNNKSLKIKEIRKVDYKGNIYDVTVKNHILLVRRCLDENCDKFTTPVWSGNSVANSTLTWYDIKDDSLVLYLDFDEGTGSIAYDKSDYGNDGILYNGSVSCYDDGTQNNGCPTWVEGKFGKALSFDGVDD